MDGIPVSEFDFSHISAQTLQTQKTARFVVNLNQSPKPVLVVRYAGEENKALQARMLAHTAKSKKRWKERVEEVEQEQATVEAVRETARELFAGPEGCIDAWEHVHLVDGTEVSFSVSACTEFLKALPDDIVDDLVVFCASRGPFRGEHEELVVLEDDAEEMAGN